jgi:trimeric autotransporter adhesin
MSSIRDFTQNFLGMPSPGAAAGAQSADPGAGPTSAGSQSQNSNQPQTSNPQQAPVLQSMSIVPNSGLMNGSDRAQFRAFGTFSGSSQPVDLTDKVSWSSSAPDVVSIDNHGVATAQPASVAVTITATDAATGITATAALQVVGVQSMTITPDQPPPLPSGGQLQFSVTAVLSDGTSLDLTSKVTWTSDNQAVDIDTGGLARGLSPGSATITATDPGTGTTASTILTVTPLLKKITINSQSPTTVVSGKFHQFLADGLFSDGSIKDITDKVRWSVDKPSVLSIVQSGTAVGLLLVGGSVDTVTVTASDLDPNSSVPEGNIQVTVEPPVLDSITIDPASPPSLAVGQQQQFSATGEFSDGTTQDMTGTAVWTLDKEDVVTFQTSAQPGLVVGVASGDATITAADPTPGSTVPAASARIKVN